VYKDLPVSRFNLDDFDDVSRGTLVYPMGDLIIDPGATEQILLGPVLEATYALAMVGTITVQDLTGGASQVCTVPQSYA
jgi:hypothetical protein